MRRRTASLVLASLALALVLTAFVLHGLFDGLALAHSLSCALRGVTLTGAFCYDWRRPVVGGNQLWCKPLAEALAELFLNTTVIDLGGGLGRYTAFLRRRGARAVCVDGAPDVARATHGLCAHMDLALPQPALARPPADWALSLEVAEHIPRRRERTFLDNLHRANRVGTVLSWAVPGQRGYHHVNGRANDEVRELLVRRGYAFDAALTAALRARAVGWRSCAWFRGSLLVFRRAGPEAEIN